MPSFRRRTRASSSQTATDRAPEGVDEPVSDEILLDLRDPLPVGRLEWGVPTRCPRCEDWGYIDCLDLNARAMQLHCPTCHSHWEITEDQIDAVNRRNAESHQSESAPLAALNDTAAHAGS